MKKVLLMGLAIGLICSSGCLWRPVDTPVYVDIGTSEEAFLIQRENNTKQASVNSEELLSKNLVQSKRIQISYRWVSTGRAWQFGSGYYMPNEQLITVDRKPETREWTADRVNGTSDKNQAIWAESSDSVGFSTGISITARIDDTDDAIKFLWNYPATPSREITVDSRGKQNYQIYTSDLASIMDSEVRTKIQEVFAEESARYNMDELREKKNETIAAIREKVIPFFEERGVTITAIGLFGGFTYENPQIQASIDKVFEAQQEEEVAKAEAKAAEQRKEALRLEGEGLAEQKKAEADGESEAIKLVADAKAYELEKLTSNPEAYISLKNIEIEMERLKVWDGKYPTYYIGQGLGGLEQPNLNLFLPSVTTVSTQ